MPCHPTPIRFQRLLLTGAAGGLGQELRARLKAYCATLRLSDIANLGDEGAGEELRPARLEDAGAVLSLQMHHHRAEHWIVVSGTAEVTNGDKVIMLTENQSTYIPLGQTHRLANPGKVPLEIIEVQSGSYLGEDDIVRFQDNYGRSA